MPSSCSPVSQGAGDQGGQTATQGQQRGSIDSKLPRQIDPNSANANAATAVADAATAASLHTPPTASPSPLTSSAQTPFVPGNPGEAGAAGEGAPASGNVEGVAPEAFPLGGEGDRERAQIPPSTGCFLATEVCGDVVLRRDE